MRGKKLYLTVSTGLHFCCPVFLSYIIYFHTFCYPCLFLHFFLSPLLISSFFPLPLFIFVLKFALKKTVGQESCYPHWDFRGLP